MDLGHILQGALPWSAGVQLPGFLYTSNPGSQHCRKKVNRECFVEHSDVERGRCKRLSARSLLLCTLVQESTFLVPPYPLLSVSQGKSGFCAARKWRVTCVAFERSNQAL